MHWAFRSLVAGAVVVLALDFRSPVETNRAPVLAVTPAVITEPAGPAPTRTEAAIGSSAADLATTDAAEVAMLRGPMRFTLQPGGVLRAVGTIDQGAAARLEAVLEANEGDVTSVSLDSPGGSLDDAIVMARMLRENGIATAVENGAICASSCPLLMAGGTARSAGAAATVGVHQFYAESVLNADPAQAMADAQLTTARIARHLEAMGVDPTLWFKALATPPQSLYYLSPRELSAYRLVTAPLPVARSGAARS